MIRAVVTDIEGTTSSLSFVKDVLFPYARKNMAQFIQSQQQRQDVAQLLDDVRVVTGNSTMSVPAIIDQLHTWIDSDQKITALKSLQGLLWESGYRNGDFQGHIYEDAVTALQHWQQQGIALYVYSSGSVYAQRLLFGHTPFGDLTPLFRGYFDTHIGAKNSPQSYQAIATDIGLKATEILFLSDIVAELDAAAAVGLQTIHLVREGKKDSTSSHKQVVDFSEIAIG